jgi:type I restriction enzyme S subunit
VCIPESTAIDYLKYELRTGDVVVQTVGSWPTNPASVVGKCVRIPVEVAGALLNQNAVKLTPADSFDRTFLFYLLRNEDFKTYIIGTAQGAASQAAITLEAIRNYEFELPSLAAQRRIAGILSAYDELIENSQRRIRILETMARTLYREWFVYFRFPGHEGSRRVSSPLGDIPEGWDVKPFGELATITMGLSPKGDTYNESGNGTPLVNGPVEFGDRFTKQVKWTTSPTKLCKKGDLVVCVRGSTTGRYVKSDDTYCLGRGVCGISSEFQTFVDLLFENELPTLLAQTSGSTFPSWTGPQLKSHPLLSPPSGLLSKFDLLVKPMSEAVLKYSHQIQNLRRTRDLLLPRLLSGQVNLEAYAA